MNRPQRPRETSDHGRATNTVELTVVTAPPSSPVARTVGGRSGTDGGRRIGRRRAFVALASTVALLAAGAAVVLGLGVTGSDADAAPAASAPPAPAPPALVPPAAASPAPYPPSPASAAPPIVPRGGPTSTARSGRTSGSSTRRPSTRTPRPSRGSSPTRGIADR